MITPTLELEQSLAAQGYDLIVGFDEVGRGALAGPVMVGCAAIWSRDLTAADDGERLDVPAGVADSKMLTEHRREAIYEELCDWCAAWAVGQASNTEIDEWGISHALGVASLRALTQVEHELGLQLPVMTRPVATRPAGGHAGDGDGPLSDGSLLETAGRFDINRLPCGGGLSKVAGRSDTYWLPSGGELAPQATEGRSITVGAILDGPNDYITKTLGTFDAPEVPIPATVTTKVKGDQHCATVATAAVIAKVTRDRLMVELAHSDPRYAPYGWDHNKGYGSAAHRAAIAEHGPTPLHRVSWHLT